MSLGNKQAKLKNKLQSILSFNDNIDTPKINQEVMTPILFILDLLSIITPNIDNIINKLFDDNFKSINNYIKTTLYENLILNIEETNINNLSFSIKISDIDNLELLNKDYNDLVYTKFYSNDLFNRGLRDIIKNNSESNLLNKGIIISRNNNELNIRFTTILSYKDFLYKLIFDENFVILNKEIILSEITKFNFNYTLEENSFESNLDYLKIKELVNNIELEKENIFDLQKYNKLDEETISISKGTFSKKLGVFKIEKKVNSRYFLELFNNNDYINSYLDIDTNSDTIKSLFNSLKLVNNIQNFSNRINNTTSTVNAGLIAANNISNAANNVSNAANNVSNAANNASNAANNSTNTNINNAAGDINNAAGDINNAAGDINNAAGDINNAAGNINNLVGNVTTTAFIVNDSISFVNDSLSSVNESLENIEKSFIENTKFINQPLSILFKYNILKNFINAVTLRSILDPKVKLLLIMNKFIRTGNSSVNDNVIEFYQSYETLISKIINNLNKNFICFLFKILKKEILRILRNILTALIKEKLIAYKNIYLSLLLPRRGNTNNFQI